MIKHGGTKLFSVTVITTRKDGMHFASLVEYKMTLLNFLPNNEKWFKMLQCCLMYVKRHERLLAAMQNSA